MFLDSQDNQGNASNDAGKNRSSHGIEGLSSGDRDRILLQCSPIAARLLLFALMGGLHDSFGLGYELPKVLNASFRIAPFGQR